MLNIDRISKNAPETLGVAHIIKLSYHQRGFDSETWQLFSTTLQLVQKLSLSTMTLLIESKRVYTAQGVPISVTGVAQVKFHYKEDALKGHLNNSWHFFGLF